MELIKLNAYMLNVMNKYDRAYKTNLRECYATCSKDKVESFEKCKDLYWKYKGTDFRIISHNRYEFTVGFVGLYEGQKAFFYISKNHTRVCYI